jgi:malate synthase
MYTMICISMNMHTYHRVYADKENEVLQGCDGAWVAHPGTNLFLSYNNKSFSIIQ